MPLRASRWRSVLDGRSGRGALFGSVVDDIAALTFGSRQVPLSVLDVAPVPEGGSVGDALRATIDRLRSFERVAALARLALGDEDDLAE
jgi:hypothetical protein